MKNLRLLLIDLGEEFEESDNLSLSLRLLFRLFRVEKITRKRARHSGLQKNKTSSNVQGDKRRNLLVTHINIVQTAVLNRATLSLNSMAAEKVEELYNLLRQRPEQNPWSSTASLLDIPRVKDLREKPQHLT